MTNDNFIQLELRKNDYYLVPKNNNSLELKDIFFSSNDFSNQTKNSSLVANLYGESYIAIEYVYTTPRYLFISMSIIYEYHTVT